LQIVNWRGGRGGHTGFSPIMPPQGKLALAQSRKRKARFEEFGHDYYCSFTMGQRHICNVNMIIYDRDDKAMTDSARALIRAMIADAAADGFGEYRAHVGFMDEIAACYDFNDHALMRINEKVKDTLDPSGILAPGKSGIWPKAYR
jgi:4-cresol dehydrogenase (hydroxylating)